VKTPSGVCVVGLWHLGCVASACLAELGLRSRGFDPDPDVVRGLLLGKPPLFEPGLEELIARNMAAGRLSFHPGLSEALRDADVALVAFDTPVDEHDESDLTPIVRAIDEVAEHANPGTLVVVSSQVPIGTSDDLEARLRRAAPDKGLAVAYCPENLNLGRAIATYMTPERLVIGADDPAVAERVSTLFSGIPAPRLMMSRRSAEMAKHALNSYLATSVSFINEVADLCETTGADVRDVIQALRTDSRIGPRAFLAPGLGFAGGTLARDIQVLRRQGVGGGRPTPLLDAVLTVNRSRLGFVRDRLLAHFRSLPGLTIAMLGLTYKPGTSTLRRSTSVAIARDLIGHGCQVRAFDPAAERDDSMLSGIDLCRDVYEAARDVDALVIATEWPEFREVDFARLKRTMRQPVVIDCKNHLTGCRLPEAGFRYIAVGVPSVIPDAGRGTGGGGE
jgi:UDPglucose 6-dehydrogenase